MTRLRQMAYRMGQAHGVLGYGAIPGADIPTALLQRYLPRAWPYSRGMRSPFVATWAPRMGAVGAVYMYETSGARARTLDVMFQRGQKGSHWDNTPKAKFEARRTHGFFVSPKDRMKRNSSLMSSRELVRRERELYR